MSKSLILATAAAVLGLVVTAAGPALADGPTGSRMGHAGMSGSHMGCGQMGGGQMGGGQMGGGQMGGGQMGGGQMGGGQMWCGQMGGGQMGGGRTGSGQMDGRMGRQMLQGFDRDGDGSFTQEDVDAVRGERFAEFDADGDGALSLAEYQALWLDAMRERMVRGFQRHDRDGDALVTVEEFTLTTGSLVERHDRNGDGMVTRDELGRRPHGEGRRGGQRPRQAPPEGDNPN